MNVLAVIVALFVLCMDGDTIRFLRRGKLLPLKVDNYHWSRKL